MLARKVCLPASLVRVSQRRNDTGQRTDTRSASLATGSRHDKDSLQERRCIGVVLKLGKQGALVATRDERKLIPGHAVQAVDATGAGDCFAGSLLARIVAGDPLVQAATYANAAAALSTLGYGAVESIPRQPEVLAFLAKAT